MVNSASWWSLGAALALLACGGSQQVSARHERTLSPPESPAVQAQKGADSEMRSKAASDASIQLVAALSGDGQATPQCGTLDVALPVLAAGADDPPVPPIVDAARLGFFFERAARLLRGNASEHLRIAVYGDSNLTMDFLTGEMRRTLQLAYGDAGHGFVALAKPWSHYKHMDVRHGLNGYESYAVSTHPLLDGRYGISGIASESAYGGAKAWVATALAPAPVGRKASRFELYHLRGKPYGKMDIVVDGSKLRSVDSHDQTFSLGIERFELKDESHKIEIVATGPRHRVRLFGMTLERGRPSFVIDSFGVGAMNTEAQAREDPVINQAMLRARNYDLIVFATGANDVFSLDSTPSDLKRIIARHRQALPKTPILILTPADRGKRETFGPTIKAVRQRAQIARDNQCAFWDLFAAMGGQGSMASFQRRGMAAPDYIHFTQAGGAYLGKRLVYALLAGLRQHLRESPQAGCGVPEAG